MEYTGGLAATMASGAGRLQFLGPLSAFGEDGNWFITLYALPLGKSYEEIRHVNSRRSIQRKPPWN